MTDIYSPIVGTISELIDYALTLITFMIIYYCFKFFMVPDPTPQEKAEMEGKVKDIKNKFDEKVAERKKDESKEQRGLQFGAIMQLLIAITKQCDDLITDKIGTSASTNLNSLKSEVISIQHKLHSCRRNFNHIMVIYKDENRLHIHKLAAYAQRLEENVKQHLLTKIPTSASDPGWDSKINSLKTLLEKMNKSCAQLMYSIDSFVKNEEKKEPTAIP